MRKTFLIWVTVAGLIGLSSCSFGKKKSGDDGSLEQATADVAQTDGVPAESAEVAANPDAGSSAPVDAAPVDAPAPDGAPVTADAALPPPPPGADAQTLADNATPPVAEPVAMTPDSTPGPDAAPATPVDTALPIAPPPTSVAADDPVTPPAEVTPEPPAPETMAAAPTPKHGKKHKAEKVAQGDSGAKQYKVRASDTLMKIAFQQYGDIFQWKRIYDNNKSRIHNPNNLEAGTVLFLEAPESDSVRDIAKSKGDRYRIKNGDTLGTIAMSIYGTPKKWKKLWTQNKALIKDPNRIFAGFFVYYSLSNDERKHANNAENGGGTAAPKVAHAATAHTAAARVPASAHAPLSGAKK